MDHDVYQQMFETERDHWWFAARHRLARSLLDRYLASSVGLQNSARPRVADLGCGCGMTAVRLADKYDVVGLDMSDSAIDFCKQRGVSVLKGFLPDSIPFEDGSFDAVLMLDVLEHVERDADSVRAAARLLRPGGVMICTSPAYQWLWTTRDQHHHHYRRYTRKSFQSLFETNELSDELSAEVSSYANTFLFGLAVAQRLKQKLFPLRAGQSDVEVPAAPVNALMREIFASERHLLGRVSLPFGLSVISVARRVEKALQISPIRRAA